MLVDLDTTPTVAAAPAALALSSNSQHARQLRSASSQHRSTSSFQSPMRWPCHLTSNMLPAHTVQKYMQIQMQAHISAESTEERERHLMGASPCCSTLVRTASSGNLACPSPCAHQMPTTAPSMPCSRHIFLAHHGFPHSNTFLDPNDLCSWEFTW